jgi:integrase
MKSFQSALGSKIESFIQYKRACGFKYTSIYYLQDLDRYCLFHGNPKTLTKEIVIGFIAESDSRNNQPYRQYVSKIRDFGRYLKSIGDYESYIVGDEYQIHRYKPVPYIFTDDEMNTFFEVIDDTVMVHRNRGRFLVIPAYFRLLYSCGCRTFEGRRLKTDDVHLSNGYLDIMNSKGKRDRRLYLSDEIIAYLSDYDDRIRTFFPKRKYFFPSTFDTIIADQQFCIIFNEIWDAAGLRKPYGKQPTPYAFRHHFAFANIRRWTQAGKDVNAMLPYLMRFMGHSVLESTLYYVHMTPDFFAAYNDMTASLESRLPEVFIYEE